MNAIFECLGLCQQENNEKRPEIQSRNNENQTISRLLKSIVIVTMFGCFLTFRLLFSYKIQKNCVYDQLHQITFGLNRWIDSNAANAFLGLGQIIVDINVTSMTLFWMICVKNFRYPAICALFFYGRGLILKMFTMPFISYQIWHTPNFPSLTVPYDHTSDFFFSGHTGTAIIFFLQARNLKFPKWIQIYFFSCIFYLIFMLITLRVHYTIDIFGGFVYSNFFYLLVSRNIKIFDQIANAPYRLVQKVKQKVEFCSKKPTQQGTSLFDIIHD